MIIIQITLLVLLSIPILAYSVLIGIVLASKALNDRNFTFFIRVWFNKGYQITIEGEKVKITTMVKHK